MAQAGRSAETLALLRDDLRGRARLVRILLVAIPPYALFCGLEAWLGDGTPGQRQLFALLAVATAAVWPFAWFVKRPVLARERAALDGRGDAPRP